MENQLQIIVKESGLEPTKAQYILENFQGYFAVAEEWEKKAKMIVVKDASQKVDMEMARVGRLFLREKRIAIENSRKKIKEQALREGKAIDGIANVLKALIVPIEEYLERQEKFVEFKEQAEREEAERQTILKAEKEEQERIERERQEQERIKLENEKLKKEAEERERKMKEEREKAEKERLRQEEALRKQKAEAEAKQKEAEAKAKKEQEKIRAEAERKQKEADEKARLEKEKLKKEADAKLLKEKKAKEKLERELKAKKEAEEEAKRKKEEEIEAQKNASDKEKLLLLATQIKDFPLPEVKSKKAIKIINQVEELLTDIIAIIEKGV